jgi:Uma2 family endonuclease
MIAAPVSTQAPLRMTVEEFDAWVTLPENIDQHWEYIGGRKVQAISRPYASEIAANIVAEIRMFVKARKMGRVTTADGGYQIMGERYIPDAAYISYLKQPNRTDESCNSNTPDLVVEVVSPSNSDDDMRIKLANYLSEGITVWIADENPERIEVYIPGQPVKVYGIDDTLVGGTVLPGFSVPVRELFPQDAPAPDEPTAQA